MTRHVVRAIQSGYCLWLAAGLVGLACCLTLAANAQQTTAQRLRPSLRGAPRQQQPPESSTGATSLVASGSASEIQLPSLTASASLSTHPQQSAGSVSRSARLANDDSTIQVTNTCEREAMKINIKLGRPFNGIIHTRNERQKAACRVEGDGESGEYNLEISEILDPKDPLHCGVVRAKKSSPNDKDILSVVVAVRFHRSIERSDDKFFLLNCTNRCRKADCSSPSAKLVAADEDSEVGAGEREGAANGNGAQPQQPANGNRQQECSIYDLPWVVALLWCMGILLLAMIISHCIMCSSMVCKCIKTEVEETAPSEYEDDDLDLEGRGDRPSSKAKHHKIIYDNRDIYKTSNNYEPYTLDGERDAKRTRRKHRG